MVLLLAMLPKMMLLLEKAGTMPWRLPVAVLPEMVLLLQELR